MRLRPYAPPKVPTEAYEHIALLFLALIVGLFLLIAWEIFQTGRSLDYLLQAGVMQGLLAGITLGCWFLLRRRRLKAEQRKTRFYEVLRDG